MRTNYLMLGLLTISLSALTFTAWAAGQHEDSQHSANNAEADRTISVEAGDMWFDPEDIQVTAGETIRFEIINNGSLEHEFVIGDKAAQEEHRIMMQDMAEGEHGGQMPSITIGAGETKTLVWTAPSNVESLEYACNIPGHYESGMYGDINF